MPRSAFVILVLTIVWAAPAVAQDSALPSGPRQKDDFERPLAGQSVEDVNARMELIFGASGPFLAAFNAITSAVAERNAAALAPWVEYPLHIAYGDQELVVENADDFVQYYDEIVTEDVMEAVQNQTYASLFVNEDGVMFGNGEMWMTAICRDQACSWTDVRIIAIRSAMY